MKSPQPLFPSSQILIYTSPDGHISVDTLVKDENIWLTQQMIASLFDVSKSTISEHFSNIFASGEIAKSATVRNFRTVQKEGRREVSRDVEYYNLDAIISVGYRVNSHRATQFRMWATERLREYLLQGFSLNEEKLKSGKTTEYFDKLQERLREIRLSERVFYQKIKDIYTTAIDYDPKAEATAHFFQTVQNKLLWAISQQTAAEIIYQRADSEKPFVGMRSYDKKTEKDITKQDVVIAKNYLGESEMKTLGLIVEQYLAFAESMAQNQTPMSMSDWIKQLDLILTMNKKDLLTHLGKISHALALAKAEKEFEKFREKQQIIEKAESLKELGTDFKQLESGITKIYRKNPRKHK